MSHPATYAAAVRPGWVRRNLAAVSIGVALLLVILVLAVLTTGGKSGDLDPDAYDPHGAHALSVLLQDNGVTVRRTTDLPSTQAAAGDATTVFLPFPGLLSDEELEAVGGLPGDLVVAYAGPRELQRLDSRMGIDSSAKVRNRQPGCALAAALRAGSAETGGGIYDGPGTHCYGGSVVDLPDSHLRLLGDAELMTNGRLAHQGNAALAVGLLASQPTVVWLIPDPARAAIGQKPVRSISQVLPAWPKAVVLELALALVLLALWRARRLGRVVPEPLPVVVRAAETVEGRGRLYRAAGSRLTAGDELRAGARRRLGPRVGAGKHPTREALLAGLQLQTSRSAEELTALLYGPEPADDDALVRLADDLDALTQEVTGT